MPSLSDAASPDFAAARRNMVEGQLRPNNVTDSRILAAMGEIPRELFVPSTLVGVAYGDDEVPLVSGRFLMSPLVLARLMQAAEIGQGDHVLELAPATGYSTLVLAALSSSIVSVEPDALLHREAEKNSAAHAAGKVKVLAGAPVESCVSHAPFDVIFINGSVEFLPQILFDQLAEGGRLAVVVRSYGAARAAHVGQARLYRKIKGDISWIALFEAHASLAPGFAALRGFEF
ncbi:MAG: protein-L-isoaspartate O-methyltransferase [Alphaproteobacteria bacterium]|nr:protein-L-isoaspartate O-methyltransferase [Alphaproteobacteria bacterium]